MELLISMHINFVDIYIYLNFFFFEKPFILKLKKWIVQILSESWDNITILEEVISTIISWKKSHSPLYKTSVAKS